MLMLGLVLVTVIVRMRLVVVRMNITKFFRLTVGTARECTCAHMYVYV